jgi:hypothetical protein
MQILDSEMKNMTPNPQDTNYHQLYLECIPKEFDATRKLKVDIAFKDKKHGFGRNDSEFITFF